MNVLIANIGSTSFKFRLFLMPEEHQLARGGVDQVGSKRARSYFLREGDDRAEEQVGRVMDQGEALDRCLELLSTGPRPVLASPAELAAVGFKAVVARGLSGVQLVNKRVLRAMEDYAAIAPAHNPPYVSAMRALRARFPKLPLVAAFETGFHETIPARNRLYAVPREWSERYGIRRHGFHGASHRYIAGRMRDLMGREGLRLISCHLGGSSSICAIRAGQSVANSFGFSAQSGLPHANRVGDLDPYILLEMKRASGKSIRKLLAELAKHAGLEGIYGSEQTPLGIEQAAAAGDSYAQLAMDVFVASARQYIGAYLVELGGADAVAFTGGMGENSWQLRQAICNDMAWCGIELDSERNRSAHGEARVSRDSSRVSVWILPTNEELVVARQTVEVLKEAGVCS